jgi:thiol:disulfide interchange protein DsbA
MSLSRRTLLLLSLLLCALPATAQSPRVPQAGKDYALLKPNLPVDTGNKIEVLEFFQYSCPHCAAYDPFLQTWRKKLPPDVEYRRIPIAWNDSTLPHVRIYYTLEALGKLDALHAKVFVAVQQNKQPLLKPDEIADFMAANGIDRKQWLDSYNSFAVATRTTRAGQIWRTYRIEGTPAMAVDGRFTTAPSMVGTREGSLLVLDFLIDRARSERTKK